ncbi:MAG: hypothetical protein ACK4NN_07155, partial [Rheinheimera sp.]
MSDRRPTQSSATTTSAPKWIGPAVAVVILGAGAWYLLKPEPVPVVVPEPVATVPAVVTPVPEPADVLSAAQEPEDDISAQAADAG